MRLTTRDKLLKEMSEERLDELVYKEFIEKTQMICDDYEGEETNVCGRQAGDVECLVENCPHIAREELEENIWDSIELSRGGLR